MSAGNAAEWAQALAIALTGGAAVYVANRQLGAFNKNELVRNTIKVLDDSRNPTTLQDVTISPLNAAAKVTEIAKNPADKALFLRLRRAKSLGLPDPELASRAKWASQIDNSIAISRNFFVDLLDLIQRRLIDKTMVMSKLSAIIVRTAESMDSLNDGSLGLGAVAELAAMARHFKEPDLATSGASEPAQANTRPRSK